MVEEKLLGKRREILSATTLLLLEIYPPFNPSLLLIWREHKMRDRALPEEVELAAFLIYASAEVLSARSSKV